MTRILVAPDSFKGSLSAATVAAALSRGLKKAIPGASVEELPVADGGEGTVEALVRATGGEFRSARVTDPLGRLVEAVYGILGDGKTAVLEMAAASGLPLVPTHARNPLLTTTFGTGELIRAALDAGCKRIIIGLGGSATNDGGAGMAQALGIRLLDEEGSDIDRGGGALVRLDRVEWVGRDPRLDEIVVEGACDVTHPVLGAQGAIRAFGPQKGATRDMIPMLEAGLKRLVALLNRESAADVPPGAQDVGGVRGGSSGSAHQPLDYGALPGGGAGGGMGVGVVAFLGGRLKRGSNLVLEALRFGERVRGADLVITGEGRLDGQTGYGKAPAAVAAVAARHGVPVIGIGGAVERDALALHNHGFDALFSVVPGPTALSEAMANGEEFCERAGEQIGRTLRLGWRIGRFAHIGEERARNVGNKD